MTLADHMRSYWHLMRTATPALTAFTVLRAAVETAASLGWVWSESRWDERHSRALRATKRDLLQFTAGGHTDSKHRYPMQRLGVEPSRAADILGLAMKGGAPKPTELMAGVGAQALYAALSGAAHGSREIVGLVVEHPPTGGQQVVPHRQLSELTWTDAAAVIKPTLVRIGEALPGS